MEGSEKFADGLMDLAIGSYQTGFRHGALAVQEAIKTAEVLGLPLKMDTIVEVVLKSGVLGDDEMRAKALEAVRQKREQTQAQTASQSGG